MWQYDKLSFRPTRCSLQHYFPNFTSKISRRKGGIHDCVNHLRKISPIMLDCARNCIGYDKARRGLAGLAPASGRRAFLLPTRVAHARFQFTVRVYGERVEARRQRGRSGSRRLALVENAIYPRRTTTCRLIAATELILERARSGDRRVFSRARPRERERQTGQGIEHATAPLRRYSVCRRGWEVRRRRCR